MHLIKRIEERRKGGGCSRAKSRRSHSTTSTYVLNLLPSFGKNGKKQQHR